MNVKTGRARPLSAEDRRHAILQAVIPLLVEKGAAVTTAEMAVAAGIAEGTIFRVFADKAALLHAAIKTVMDPVPVQARLAAIDPGYPIDVQFEEAADVLAERYENVTALLGMVRSMPHHDTPTADSHRIAKESMTAVVESLSALMERHRDRLLVEPVQAAIVLRGLIFTNAHHMLSTANTMTTGQLVAIVLNGVLDKGDN